MVLGDIHDQDVAAVISDLGYIVEPFGQALLSDDVRRRLRQRGCPAHLSLMRWLPDRAVMVPGDLRRLGVIDAKTQQKRNSSQPNHSIEMRSILGSRITRIPAFYVCCDMKVLNIETLYDRVRKDELWEYAAHTGQRLRACCDVGRAIADALRCIDIFRNGSDEIQISDSLPEYCPVQLPRINRGLLPDGSGTPYVLIPRNWCQPLETIFPRLDAQREDGAA
jgi:hypothetical protein